MEKTFEFRQIRDLGAVISHSFDFIKLEYKRLGKALLVYVLPFLVVTGIIQVLVQRSFYGNYMQTLEGGTDPLASFKSGTIFITYLLQAINYTILSSVVLLFLFLHQKKDADFKIEEIWPSLFKVGLKLFFAMIVIAIICTMATAFFIIPGIYLGIVFSLVGPVIVFEETGLGTAINRSFQLIKDNWWKTFGILIIGIFIYYIFTVVISLPLIIFGAFKTFSAISEQTTPDLFNTGYLISNTIISIIQTLGYSLLIIFISIQYFSLLELKERPTLQEKVDKLASENA